MKGRASKEDWAYKRLLNTESKLRVDEGEGTRVGTGKMGDGY